MSEGRGQKTAPEVQAELHKRIGCLYEIIRSAESSRCLADWLGTPENLEKGNWGGYGHLFGHIQYIAYTDFVTNTVSIFEPNKDKKRTVCSFPALFDFALINKAKIKVTGFSRWTKDEKHSEAVLCQRIGELQKKLPEWPRKGFTPEPESLDFALDRMKYKRDKLIAHREYLDCVAPRASQEMLEDGCGLLPLAMELYDSIYQIASPDFWNHFHTSQSKGDGRLLSIRCIAKLFESVVSGEFARKGVGR